MLSRRAFALTMAGLALGSSRAARAQALPDGEETHPIEPPPCFDFRIMSWSRPTSNFFYDGNCTAICAVPRDLAPGAQLPLVVLLPGGHHNMQRHDKGAWGWWYEYRLGDTEMALRRGVLSQKDFRDLGRDDEIERFNGYLATTPYRGSIIITPWVVGRQIDPAPHGAMVAAFLRDVVARARAELPVIPTREATGLGGMSSGGLWALHAGSACSDLFGTLVATQPFTEELTKPLRAAVNAREHAQRVRIVTSELDHQREPTLALSAALRDDGIAHELVEYRGSHSAAFAAGPGGIDAMVMFDRALRGEAMDGTRPLPARDGAASLVALDDLPRRTAPPRSFAAARAPLSPKWPLFAIGAVTAGAAMAMRRTRD